MKSNRALYYMSRFNILMLLYIIFFIAGSLAVDPLMPLASIRFSHMIETAISTFIFGVIVVYVLYRKPAQPENTC